MIAGIIYGVLVLGLIVAWCALRARAASRRREWARDRCDGCGGPTLEGGYCTYCYGPQDPPGADEPAPPPRRAQRMATVEPLDLERHDRENADLAEDLDTARRIVAEVDGSGIHNLGEQLPNVDTDCALVDLARRVLAQDEELRFLDTCLTVANGGPYQIYGKCVHILESELERLRRARDELITLKADDDRRRAGEPTHTEASLACELADTRAELEQARAELDAERRRAAS